MASEHTSVNQHQRLLDPYTLSFAPELIEYVLNGQLRTAYRFGDKYDYLQVGDQVRLLNARSQDEIGFIKILDKHRKLFRELPISADGAEGYPHKERQREVLSGYYAYLGRPIADEDLFLVFDFELLSQTDRLSVD